ncbi:hypothetical protein ACFX2I_037159 [Malus domestica]
MGGEDINPIQYGLGSKGFYFIPTHSIGFEIELSMDEWELTRYKLHPYLLSFGNTSEHVTNLKEKKNGVREARTLDLRITQKL